MISSINHAARLQFLANSIIDLSTRDIVRRHDQGIFRLQGIVPRNCFEPRLWILDLSDATVLLQYCDSERSLPLWVDFACGMAPIMYPVSEQAAKLLRLSPEAKILDITASHGLFGIAVAKQNPTAHIVALDFPSVLAVAKENAERFGVSDRYSLLPGNALKIPFGNDFDAILVPNILHQWDRPIIETFLKKVHASLKPGGQVLIIEFAPNDDRVFPPMPASFVLNMLVNTTGGDAYPLSELMQMLRNGGFLVVESHSLLPSPQTAIVGIK